MICFIVTRDMLKSSLINMFIPLFFYTKLWIEHPISKPQTSNKGKRKNLASYQLILPPHVKGNLTSPAKSNLYIF